MLSGWGGGGDDSSYTLGMDCIIRSSPCVWGRRAIYNLSGVDLKPDSLTQRGVYWENVTNFDKTVAFCVKVSRNLAHAFLSCDEFFKFVC